MVAHERLTEPRGTIEWLLQKWNSLSDLPAFLGSYGIANEKVKILKEIYCYEKFLLYVF